MRTDAQKKADAKYREKTRNFMLSYSGAEIAESARLDTYLKENSLKTSAFLKTLVKSYLDAENIPYPEPLPVSQHDDLEQSNIVQSPLMAESDQADTLGFYSINVLMF